MGNGLLVLLIVMMVCGGKGFGWMERKWDGWGVGGVSGWVTA